MKRYDIGQTATGIGMVENPTGEYVKADAATDLLAACKELPDFDLECPDASDFKDNAKKFMRAMTLARAAIAKAEGK